MDVIGGGGGEGAEWQYFYTVEYHESAQRPLRLTVRRGMGEWGGDGDSDASKGRVRLRFRVWELRTHRNVYEHVCITTLEVTITLQNHFNH